jgi:hypothetical protein
MAIRRDPLADNGIDPPVSADIRNFQAFLSVDGFPAEHENV